MQDLSKIEELFLIAILRLGENAYGVTIRRDIARRTKKEYTYGTVYSVLEQLLRKGYVDKAEGEPSPERGGRRKLLYGLTPAGKSALKRAYEMQRIVWNGIDGSAIDAESAQ